MLTDTQREHLRSEIRRCGAPLFEVYKDEPERMRALLLGIEIGLRARLDYPPSDAAEPGDDEPAEQVAFEAGLMCAELVSLSASPALQ